jgi:hypothetical protein
MRKLLFAILVSAFLSVSFNVWQAYNIQNLNSENQVLNSQLSDFGHIKEPMVHLINYEWAVTILDWEHQRVDVNFTLFNSGLSPATFTLSIDLFDTSKEGYHKHVDSNEWELTVNGTTVETFNKRFHLTRPAESNHIDCIEFYCPYFFENSLGYELSIG